jgi:hypothetical protein
MEVLRSPKQLLYCSLAKIGFGFAPPIDFAGFSQKVGMIPNY